MFINKLPYTLGIPFEDCSIDLKFIEVNSHMGKLYKSQKLSEVYIFGKKFNSNCFLWFQHEKITRIKYLFDLKHFDLFYNSINENLPEGYFLKEDPLNNIEMYDCFINNLCISLNKLKDYISLEIWEIKSNNPSL
ncbi:hypothetical protein MK851_04870 [Tenacibaculum sp. 1B UA]|uniref:hypothetical protein n=1 Tax=unclassified Tenacibaculum TaxID=2635139 RepID=UPI0026E1B69C|nr:MULTISPECIES: hypothetical protein [unclassified Tenacibaculum]MDO6676317.1 hypothetical protein [Tenacibaculum sp. 1_MG-2023]MDX8552958.1 hypothetical protein [Tenacibaculum sp. 1B UA]